VLRRPSRSVHECRPGRWRPLYGDSVSQLLVRTTTALPAPLVASPESAYRQLSLGVTALLQLEAARRHLERALQVDPDLQPACTTLVEVQLLGGDVRSATATAARCTSRYPDHDRDERLRPIFERLRAAQDGPG
jgi:Tfp pilus assembly protein PilF